MSAVEEQQENSREERRRLKARKRLCEDLAEALADEEFMMEVVMWAWERCLQFEFGDPTTWEHSLEFTKMHAEYRELYENRAEKFLGNHELTIEEFLKEVKEHLEAEEEEAARGLLDALTASEDYLSFCKFMQQVRQRREWAEGLGFTGDFGDISKDHDEWEVLEEEGDSDAPPSKEPAAVPTAPERAGTGEELGSARWGPAAAPKVAVAT